MKKIHAEESKTDKWLQKDFSHEIVEKVKSNKNIFSKE